MEFIVLDYVRALAMPVALIGLGAIGCKTLVQLVVMFRR